MTKNLNISEILESVDVIVSKSKDKVYKKKIDMSDNPITEKIIMDAEQSLKNKTIKYSKLNLSDPLILENEFEEKENNIEDLNFVKINNNLEKSYINEIKQLKSENIKQDEIIKDLNILLQNFKKQKKYSDLYNKIKLYQDDNAELRKKIFNLKEIEDRLRKQVIELRLDKKVSK